MRIFSLPGWVWNLDPKTHWSASSVHEECPKGYLFNWTPPSPGQSRKWEDWELPCYVICFLTIVILGVGLNAKFDLTIETWAHRKALERLEFDSSRTQHIECE
ncbi:Hypothetical predicted protein [Olea europaea subsp. europaea]|uniref:Uncharacterized protein n=1 Tax=Olea europaea subsp. europaea TaxID=158383 RepID=A0A8S0TVS6_OLEEU|nr:Hypothetical predicted protein [Olea europaea subsp. europaea]